MNTPTKLKCGQTPTKATCDRTPTPRTDEAWAAWQYAGSGISVHVGRELERELTAVTEQRDDLKKELEIANLRLKGKRHPDDNGIMAEGEIDVKALTEQRDKALQKIKNQAERIAYLEGATNHATGTPLSKAIEQRDRLADLVKQFIYILDITEESDGGRLFHPTNITSCRAGDLQKIGQLVEALRRASRDQPTEP
jgi:hypothetical protein